MKINIIYGVKDISDSSRYQIGSALRTAGVEVAGGGTVRAIKSGIDEMVDAYAEPEPLVLILSRELEPGNPFTIRDLLRYQRAVRDVKIILVVEKEDKGSEILKDMSDNGMFLALYGHETSANAICSLIISGRSAAEAKKYYGVEKLVNVTKLLTIEGAERHMGQPVKSDGEYLERARWVRGALPSEDMFVELVHRLPDRVKEVLSHDAGFRKYVEGYVLSGGGSAGRKAADAAESGGGKGRQENRKRERQVETGKEPLQEPSTERKGGTDVNPVFPDLDGRGPASHREMEDGKAELLRAELAKKEEECRKEKQRLEEEERKRERARARKEKAVEKESPGPERKKREPGNGGLAAIHVGKAVSGVFRRNAEGTRDNRALQNWNGGKGTIGVYSLRHLTGTSYLAAAVANHLESSTGRSVAVVLNDLKYSEDTVKPRVQAVSWAQEPDIYRTADYVVYDAGVYGELSTDRRRAVARADLRVLLCRADGEYLSRLAGHLEAGCGNDAAFLFNGIPPEWERRVLGLMDFPAGIYFAPTLYALSPSQEATRVFDLLLRKG